MNRFARSCAFVADDPKHVFINEQRIEEVASEMALKDLKIPAWRDEVFPEGDENIIEFLGVVNSINFCFTDFKTGQKYDVEYPEGSGKIWHGSFGMAAAVKRAIDDGFPMLYPKFLEGIDLETVKHIFRHKTMPIPMLHERLVNLRTTGASLRYWHGSFNNIFERFGYNLILRDDGIVETLTYFLPSYRDSSCYRGRSIKFNKRAQLFPMVYHGRALSSEGRLQPIRDPENFGSIADYEVAKVLRALGVLQYNPGLAIAVEAGAVINKDSFWEIEIRAQTVNAMSELLKRIDFYRSFSSSKSITMAELDYAIWSAGRSLEYQNIRHHYTYTTAC